MPTHAERVQVVDASADQPTMAAEAKTGTSTETVISAVLGVIALVGLVTFFAPGTTLFGGILTIGSSVLYVTHRLVAMRRRERSAVRDHDLHNPLLSG